MGEHAAARADAGTGTRLDGSAHSGCGSGAAWASTARIRTAAGTRAAGRERAQRLRQWHGLAAFEGWIMERKSRHAAPRRRREHAPARPHAGTQTDADASAHSPRRAAPPPRARPGQTRPRPRGGRDGSARRSWGRGGAVGGWARSRRRAAAVPPREGRPTEAVPPPRRRAKVARRRPRRLTRPAVACPLPVRCRSAPRSWRSGD